MKERINNKMEKIKKVIVSIMLSLILCIPSFAANASQPTAYYGGIWWDLNSKRCYMEITPYNDMILLQFPGEVVHF